MNHSHILNRPLALSGLALAIVIAAGGGYYWGKMHAHPAADEQPAAPAERRVLYWYDPMVPDKRFDKPGKSPFMDMQLIARYADDVNTTATADNAGGVTISARQQQNLGVRTATAETRTLASSFSAYGTVAINERALHTVVAPSGGIVEQLHVGAVQQSVKKGEALATLWNPAWAAAQQEYLAVRRLGDGALTQAARQRLALLFMPENVIRQVERSGKTQPRVVVSAPQDGYVNRLDIRAGMQLTPPQPLFELAALDPVWLDVDYPEAQAALLVVGSRVTAVSRSWPGQTFDGSISELLPLLANDTRTLKARVVLDNPRHQLKPGMYLTLSLTSPAARPALVIPQEALLISASRNRVLLSEADGYFIPREVQVGRVQDGWAEILSGLRAGDRVVTSGQFLIDSEASLRSSLSQFGADTPAAAAADATPRYQTQGVIKAVQGNQATISHDAIEALGWAPMTMDFTLPDGGLPAGIAAGSAVAFSFSIDDVGIRIHDIAPAHTDHGGHP